MAVANVLANLFDRSHLLSWLIFLSNKFTLPNQLRESML